jgi:predicted DNA-binding protein
MAVERIALRLSADLKARLSARVSEDQYGTRGKSRWIREALVSMIEADPHMQRVGQGDQLDQHSDNDLFTFSRPFMVWFNDKILEYQMGAPGVPGVRTLLLRSAIRFRLENPDRFLAKPSSAAIGRL